MVVRNNAPTVAPRSTDFAGGNADVAALNQTAPIAVPPAGLATDGAPGASTGATPSRVPADAESQKQSRQRANADPAAAFLKHALMQGVATDSVEGAILSAFAGGIAEAFVGLANAALQGSEGDFMAAMGELGLPNNGVNDPATRDAISKMKQDAGFPPNGELDLEALIALLMRSADEDQRQSAPQSGGSSGGANGGGRAPQSGGSSAGGSSSTGQGTSSTGTSSTGTSSTGTNKVAKVDGKNWTPGAGDVTPDQLRKIVPSLTAQKANEVAPHLNVAMREANISTPERKAAFIAQMAHESGGFKYNEEIASGKAYEGRRDLGNVKPGDGTKFKGRGYIQLTGRANYEAAGKALGLDLANNPELAAKPENASRVAAWYWNSRGLNKLADQGNFDGITKRINGGYNGKADRDAYHRRALQSGLPGGLPTTGKIDASTTSPVGSPTPSASTTGAAGSTAATGVNTVAPSTMSEAEKYAHYKQQIEANGGRVNETPGQRNLLGLRQETSTRANGGNGVYDDKLVMLWKDAQGNPHVREYQANTEPSARYEDRMGQDANGDGRLDQGQLRPGFYEFAPSTFRGGNALRMIGDAQVDRDTNHDGRFNDGVTSSGGASMLFHVGGNNITGSAGCQTLPPAEFNRFWSDLTAGGRSPKFGYTLVNQG